MCKKSYDVVTCVTCGEVHSLKAKFVQEALVLLALKCFSFPAVISTQYLFEFATNKYRLRSMIYGFFEESFRFRNDI